MTIRCIYAAAMSVALCGATLEGATFNLLARSGQIAGGATVEKLYDPLINASGSVAFLSNPSGERGLPGTAFVRTPTGLQRLAGPGDTAIGLPSGATFRPTDLLAFNARGETLLRAEVANGGAVGGAIIHVANGVSTAILKQGDSFGTGTVDGLRYGTGFIGSQLMDYPSLSDDGFIAIPVTNNQYTQYALYAGRVGSLSPVITSAVQAPGITDAFGNAVSATFGAVKDVDVHADGSITFYSAAKLSTGETSRGSWRYADGTITPVLTDQHAFASGYTEVWGTIRTDHNGQTYLRGQAYPAEGPTQYGLWKLTDGALSPIFREGDIIPGTDGSVISRLNLGDRTLISNDGTVVVTPASGGGNSNVLDSMVAWDEEAGLRALLTARLSPLPGGQTITNPGFASINSAEELISFGWFSEPGSSEALQVMFHGSTTEGLIPVFLQNDTLMVDGIPMVISDLIRDRADWTTDPIDVGRSRFNDLGQAPVVVVLADGSYGVLLVTMPEPATGLGLLLLCPLARRRR